MTVVKMGMVRLGADVVETKKRDQGLAPVTDSPNNKGAMVQVTKEITVHTATITKVTIEAATASNSSKRDVVLTVMVTSKKMVSIGQNSPSP